MNKTVLTLAALLLVANVNAITYIHPSIPGTDSDDGFAGGMAIDGDRIYPTISLSGAEDPTRSGYVREGNEWVETLPMTTVVMGGVSSQCLSAGDMMKTTAQGVTWMTSGRPQSFKDYRLVNWNSIRRFFA